MDMVLEASLFGICRERIFGASHFGASDFGASDFDTKVPKNFWSHQKDPKVPCDIQSQANANIVL